MTRYTLHELQTQIDQITASGVGGGSGDVTLEQLTTTSGDIITYVGQELSTVSGGGSTDLTNITSDLLPNMVGASGVVSVYDIGSSSKKFQNLYVHDAYIDAGSLYVNDKKVLEDVSDTITISTDVDQDLAIKTTGLGDINLLSSHSVSTSSKGGIELIVPADQIGKDINITNSSNNGGVYFTAAGSNQSIEFLAFDNVGFTSETVTMDADVTITGTLDAAGGFFINGEEFTGGGSGDVTQEQLTTTSGDIIGYVDSEISSLEGLSLGELDYKKEALDIEDITVTASIPDRSSYTYDDGQYIINLTLPAGKWWLNYSASGRYAYSDSNWIQAMTYIENGVQVVSGTESYAGGSLPAADRTDVRHQGSAVVNHSSETTYTLRAAVNANFTANGTFQVMGMFGLPPYMPNFSTYVEAIRLDGIATSESSGSSEGISSTSSGTAAETIPQYRVVYADATSSGHLNLGEYDQTEAKANTFAIVTEDGGLSAGQTGEITLFGKVTNPEWNWSPNADLFLSASGTLTETQPTAASTYVIPCGHSLVEPTEIWFSPKTGWKIGASSIAAAGPLVRGAVEGRFDRNSDTELIWTPVNGNGIGLWNGYEWRLVTPATDITAANTATTLSGVALAVDSLYDVFAEYVSDDEFKFVFKHWDGATAGASDRGYTLHQHQGVYVEADTADGRKRRWLGTIYAYNNSSVVNFKDENNLRLISNYYNKCIKGVRTYNTNGESNYTTSTWREMHGGTGQVRGYFVICSSLTADIHITARLQSSNTSGGAYVGVSLDSTTEETASTNSKYERYHKHGSSDYVEVSNGYHYITLLEKGVTGTAITNGDSVTFGQATFGV